jgi:antitoxin (DNA-binding transcriptional repressor) of toxin-antitoxin stability system
MEEIAVLKFKATCLKVLGRVSHTRKPVLVTRFGKPIAKIIPPPPASAGDWVGALRGTARIEGDIVSPVADETDWEIMSDS